MTTTQVHVTYDESDYYDMLDALRSLAVKAAGVEGATDVGAFHPITTGDYREFGQFSSLSEFLDDFAGVLQTFLHAEGDELEGWHAA
jgi:hypothetical protein